MAPRHSTTAEAPSPAPETAEEWAEPGMYQQPSQPGPSNRDPLSQPYPQEPQPAPDGDGSASDLSGSAAPTSKPPLAPEMFRRKAKMYEALARGVFRAVGGLLNKQLGVADDPADNCWIPDDEDEAAVPPPLGRLAAKYAPIGDGQDLTDLENIGAAAVGLVAWGAKSMMAMWDARKRRRTAMSPIRESGAVVFDDQGEAQQTGM